MYILQAIFLGVLQGATEFLPISSSGHLALAHAFFGSQGVGLTFDVVLHMGSLLAILIYFRDDFLQMARALLFFKDKTPAYNNLRKLVAYIGLATIPGVIAGVLLGDLSETLFRNPAMIASALGGAGLLLLWADKSGKRCRSFQSITTVDALLIGMSQALSIIPGVSRSGITMTAALFLGLNRQAAVRFSFLLSAPITFGAGIYKVPAIIEQGLLFGQLSYYIAGFISSFGAAYLVIAFLMKFIKTKSFAIFAYYCVLLAMLVFIALLFGWA